MKRITGSVVVCVGAGLFTAGALFYQPATGSSGPAPAAVAAVAPSGPYAKGPANKPASAASLAISGFAFSASRARPDASVSVTNADDVAHTVTADNGGFAVTVPAHGTALFAAPRTPGTYRFTCSIHPSMHGTLVVAVTG
jgi:plastocyanin